MIPPTKGKTGSGDLLNCVGRQSGWKIGVSEQMTVSVTARESHIDVAVRRALPGGPIGYRDRRGILFMAKCYIEALPDHGVTTEFVESIRREWRKGYPFK